MVALYRAGRQPEALEAFRAGRAALVEAFGLEPTPALKELESRVLLQDPALDAPSRPRLAPAREERRTVLLAARDGAALDGLVAVGRCLAALGRHELLVTQAVESEASLADAVAATRARRDELATAGVTARAAAFVSRAFGPDMARLALTHDADVTVVDRLGSSQPTDPSRRTWRSCSSGHRATSHCSPERHRCPSRTASRSCSRAAITTGRPRSSERGSPPARPRGSSSSASGAATEADASRLLASASIAIQQVVGVDVEPVLADAGPDGLVAAAGSAGVVVVGLSPRWRREGLGESRRALLAAGSPTLVVHRGARPGGLAPREQLTRFTWTIAGGRLINRAGRARRGRRS